MSPPHISVLLPCFNDGRWIDEAIDSVRQQTFQDFEIVIVDDGSTGAGLPAAFFLTSGWLDGPGEYWWRARIQYAAGSSGD